MELNISSPGNRRPRPAEAAEESEAVRGAPDGRACARQGAPLRVGVRGKGARKWPAAPFDLRLRRYGYGRLRAADRRMPSQASPQGRKSADDSQTGPGWHHTSRLFIRRPGQ